MQGRVLATTSSSSSGKRGTIVATNVIVENSSVTLPASGTATSSGSSVLGTTNRVVATGGASILGYRVVDSDEGENSTFSIGTAVSNAQVEANVEDYMYEKLREDYTEQGSDTSMLYERTALEEYAIAYEFGDTIYDLCFKTDPFYDTYEDLFTQVMSCFNSGIPSDAPSASDASVKYNISTGTSLRQRFAWYSYLFCEQTPNDIKRYNVNVKLPPIAAFKLSTLEANRTPAMAKHLFLMQHFSMMKEYSNRYTNGPLKQIPHQITHWYKDDEFKLNKDWDNISCDYGSQFFDGNKGGIIREPSNKWKNLDLRSKLLQARVSSPSLEPFDYSPGLDDVSLNKSTFESNYWYVPDILEVTTEQLKSIPVITIKSFEANSSAWEDNNGSRTSTKPVMITDKATPALYDDINMFYKFFKKCTEVAAYPLSRGYSHKKNILNILYREDHANDRLQFDDNFPYIINKSLPWTHYFIAWNYLYENGEWDPSTTNPERPNFPARYNRFQFYSWLWFHYKKAPTTYKGTRGMTVELNANNDRVLPYWYSNMNSLTTDKKPSVEIVYISYNIYLATSIAKQNQYNLAGNGESLDDKSYVFNKKVGQGNNINAATVWKLINYPTYFSNKDKNTKNLTFPDPDSVDAYIDD